MTEYLLPEGFWRWLQVSIASAAGDIPHLHRRSQWRSRSAWPVPAQIELLEARQLLSVTFSGDGGATPLASSSPGGLTPAQVLHAYGIDQVSFNGGAIKGDGTGQTIAITDLYDDPTIAADLATFDTTFGIAAPPSFTKVAADGSTNYPPTDPAGKGNSWAIEISLDVEWAHAMAPGAKILLVEAGNGYSLTDAAKYAVTHGATVVSMSYSDNDSSFNYATSGVVFVAATGDDGKNSATYPAVSPNVVAVGGTALTIDGSNNWSSETGWKGSSGGITGNGNPLLGIAQPSYQNGVVSTFSTTNRCTPDVAFDASSTVAVCDSWDYSASTPWAAIGGTSLSAPCWAGIVAIADQGRVLAGGSQFSSSKFLTSLYALPASDFHDITTGQNANYTCGVGYDLVTGLGTPKANLLIPDLAGQSSTPLTLATPSLTATAGSPTKVNLTWTAVSQALGYRVYQMNGSQATLLTTLGASATTYQVTGLTPASNVSFYVEAYNGSVIADSAQANVTLPLAAPSLTVTAGSPTNANLAWGAVSQALGYRVYQVSGSQATLLTTLGAGATSYQVTGLTPASTMTYYVEAYSSSITADSAQASVTLPLATPSLTATAGSTTAANLAWTTVSQALGFRVYQVNGSQSTLLATLGAGATSYQVTGLTPASTVTLYVEAYNGSVTADSAQASVTLPLATPSLTVTIGSPTKANLAWGAVPQALGFRVYQVNGSQSTLLTALGAGATSYQVTGLTPASSVTYYVEAYNGSVTADSAQASITLPLATPSLTATAGSTTVVNLAWTDVSQALGFRVYQVNGSQSTLLATLAASAASYQVTGLTPASTVTYYVEAYNGSVIADSAQASVTLPLATPNMTATAGSTTVANLAWTTVSQSLGFRVYQLNGSQSTLLTTLGASAISYQVTGLTPASTVTFYVEAYNGSVTADSAQASVTLPLATPSLTVTAGSPSKANLAWGAVSQALGYRVYQVNGSQSTLLATLAASATSYQVTGLTPASAVTFYVEAYNGSVIADSAQTSVTLPLATPSLTATAGSTTVVNLAWTTVSQSLGFRVYQVNGSQSTLLAALAASATSYQVTGLTPASTVTYYVEAYNGSVIADSAQASVTLPLATPSLTATAGSTTAANLTWSAVSQALGFRVYQVNGSQSTLLTTLGASATSYQVTGLTPASSVTYYVEAYNGSVIADSAQGSVTLPLATPSLTVTAGSPTKANLAWGAASQSLGYRVYQVSGSQSTLLATLAASATSYQVTGLTPASTVTYYVEAYNGSVIADSAQGSVTLPLATPSLAATAGSPTKANLAWGAVSQSLGFRVYQVSGSQSTLLTTLGASATTYQVTGLTPASSVTFYVEAYNGSVIADSAQASVTLPLATPSLTVTVGSPTKANLAWGAVSQALGFRVYQVNGSQSTLLTTLGASATTYQVTGLTPASSVTFYVEAYNGSVIADSAQASVTLPLATPSLSATVGSPTSANLGWTAVSQALGFRVYQVSGSQSTLLATLSASSISYQATSLTSGSTVSFFVEAYNGSVIADSATASVTLPVGPTLTSFATLGTANLQTPFNITYATLLAASNAADSNGQPIQFRINSIQNGTLSLVHNNVTSAVVASPTNGTLCGAGDTLIWTGPAGVWGNGVSAFSVTAFDGSWDSVSAVQVKINVSSLGSQYDLSGPWVVANSSGTSLGLGNISQTGASLTLVNASAASSSALYTSQNQITATNFDGSATVVGTIDTSTADQGRIVWADGTVWLRISLGGQYSVSGPWINSPTLASITQNGIQLSLVNGSTTGSATVTSTSQLTVSIGGNSSQATFGDGRISFTSNGQVWTKLDLPPDYTNPGGAGTHIIQNGTSLTFVDKFGNTSPGYWTSPTQLFATAWNETATTAAGKLVWQDGTVWSENLVLSGARNGSGTTTITATPSQISVTDYITGSGKTVHIVQTGTTNLVFIDSTGHMALATFMSSTQAFSNDYRGDIATFSPNKITWSDGAVWMQTTATSAVIVTHYTNPNGIPVHVVQNATSQIAFVDGLGRTSLGTMLSATTAVSNLYPGDVATFSGNTVNWKDGTVWTQTNVVPLMITLTDTNGAVSHVQLSSRTTLVGLDGPLSGLNGIRQNGQIVWSNGTVWNDFDFNALNALFQMANGYP